jgi:putative redox protein
MPNLSVAHQGGDRFELGMRGHRLTCDQPLADGGDDQGPTPTELFVGSLAACVGFYARRSWPATTWTPPGCGWRPPSP